jgi:hypothetical protein
MSILLSRAMEITTQEEANTLFEELVVETMAEHPEREAAESVVRAALGYFAGYYDHETRARVEHLFQCEHPILGAVKNGVPLPEEIFRLGMKMGENWGPMNFVPEVLRPVLVRNILRIPVWAEWRARPLKFGWEAVCREFEAGGDTFAELQTNIIAILDTFWRERLKKMPATTWGNHSVVMPSLPDTMPISDVLIDAPFKILPPDTSA